MRLIRFEDRTYKISEKDYAQLMRRFDAGKAFLSFLGYFIIPVSLICAKRLGKCSKCSLSDPRKKVNSCTLFFKKILGEKSFGYLHFFDNGVLWDPRFDGEARRALQHLREALSGAKKL